MCEKQCLQLSNSYSKNFIAKYIAHKKQTPEWFVQYPRVRYCKIQTFLYCSIKMYTKLKRYCLHDQFKCNFRPAEEPLIKPRRSTLRLHLNRVNFQAYIWNKADPACPAIGIWGWKIIDGILREKWISNDIFPLDLSNLLVDSDLNGTVDVEDFDDVIFEDVDNATDI